MVKEYLQWALLHPGHLHCLHPLQDPPDVEEPGELKSSWVNGRWSQIQSVLAPSGIVLAMSFTVTRDGVDGEDECGSEIGGVNGDTNGCIGGRVHLW